MASIGGLYVLIDPAACRGRNPVEVGRAALEGGAVTYQSYDGPSPVVRVHGSVATLSGTAELRATARGTRVQLWIRYLAVYVKRGDTWRLIDYQSTRLEIPPSGGK